MYVRVRVTPDARRERIEEGKDGELLVRVREPAQGNQANTRVRTLLAERFGVSLGAVRILTGHRSSGKMISISTPS